MVISLLDFRGEEAARLALMGDAAPEILHAAALAAGVYLFKIKHKAKAALKIFQSALEKIEKKGGTLHPLFLRWASECAERIGETELQISLLEKALNLKSDDNISMAQIRMSYALATKYRQDPEKVLQTLRETADTFTEQGDVRSRAVTMGKIADILHQRGESGEALRIRREEQLPVYERLGDVRSRAVTMAQIAAILHQRGESGEALRILTQEALPDFKKIMDIKSIAEVTFFCAQIRLDRGGLSTGETQTISEELSESFRLNTRLDRPIGIAASGWILGQILATMKKTADALDILERTASAMDRLKWVNRASQVLNS